jgi:hypothetical protein
VTESGAAATPEADPRPAAIVMIATYVVGAVGVFLGFLGLAGQPASLTLGTLLAVGLAGVLSFIRHSLLHRSDAARMGWDYGQRNNFQIEVGLANLAWGAVAIVAVAAGWPIEALGALCLVEGVYLTSVFGMQLLSPGGRRRAIGPMVGIGAYGIALVVMGAMGAF